MLVNIPFNFLQDIPPYWPANEDVSLTINDIKVSLTKEHTSDNAIDSTVFTVERNGQVNILLE